MTTEQPKEPIQYAIDLFWETIPPLWNNVRGSIHQIVSRRSDITVEEFHILRHIRKGRCSVSEIATVKQISRSAVSQAVDGLVEKRFVARIQNTADRRYVTLELTPDGNSLLDSIFKENRAWMAEKLALLTSTEQACINQAFELLKKALGPGQS